MKTNLGHPTSSFLWGAATSAHQVEGHNFNNDWARFENQGHIEGGVRSGSATDHLNRFKEDIRLAKELGLNAYRFSIEWSRIEPEKGHFDARAIAWYHELIKECLNNDIVPMATLHHFSSPIWFADEGGFSGQDAARTFAFFAKKVASEYVRYVPLWCTINEPLVLTLGGYIGKFMPPGLFAPQLVPKVITNLLWSHKLAYEALHSEAARLNEKGYEKLLVGFAHNFIDFLPDRKYHPIETLVSKYMNQLYNWGWLDAIFKKKINFRVPMVIGNIKKLPFDLNELRSDFVGVNYYTKGYVQWWPRDSSSESIKEIPLGISFARRKEDQSDLGWAIHPNGFKKMLKRVESYGSPIYITENGIDDRRDRHRTDFIVEHLKVIAKRIKKGADIRGYFHWSLLDNFEWIKGYGPRFGLYYVDYETFERRPTDGARLYRKIIKHHSSGVPSPEVLSKFHSKYEATSES